MRRQRHAFVAESRVKVTTACIEAVFGRSKYPVPGGSEHVSAVGVSDVRVAAIPRWRLQVLYEKGIDAAFVPGLGLCSGCFEHPSIGAALAGRTTIWLSRYLRQRREAV